MLSLVAAICIHAAHGRAWGMGRLCTVLTSRLGNNWACIYDHADTLLNLQAAGHTLASHTWSHPDLTKLDYNGIDQELEKVEAAFIKILGLKPTYFRPPYGNYNDLVLQVLRDRGYQKVFIWSDDTEDADGQSVSYGQNVITSAANTAGPHMVLMHSTEPHTHDQLVPFALTAFKNKGYGIVSADTCLGSDGEWPYVYIGPPGTRDSTWKC